ncbi:MAG: glycosyltransferase family 39 protein [Chloroflexi bacterium]|nr:glycosyltransferase family 39 protein [Chloroflexota bacterium]
MGKRTNVGAAFDAHEWVFYNARLIMLKRHLPIILILLLALALRLYALADLPPGLTHDEANHGREAIGILDGILLFYFPLNYGSEPLYSYTAAASMALFGENLFALRLVNVLFGVAAIGVMFAWVKRLFGRQMALLTAVLMTISFWPLASSRQALRAGMLPLFMIGAVWFYWQMMAVGKRERPTLKQWLWPVVGFAGSVAITLHIYLAARVAWLLFPLFLIYLLLAHRHTFRQMWPPTLAGLLLAAVLVMPMFLYLQQYPYALTRLDMLDRPLQDLQSGNILPILQNGLKAMLAFFWPGYGDQFLAYNIPGRPVLRGVTAVFFLTGIIISLWRWRQPRYTFLLLWFGVGIAPSLITGPTANTTRNLAALPVVYLLPAIGFWASAAAFQRRSSHNVRPLVTIILAGWLLLTGITAGRDYFIRWGQSPEVRGAYQRNLVEAIDYLEQVEGVTAVVMSTVYPGPVHDPSIDLLLSSESQLEERWVDARYALLIPDGAKTAVIIPSSTPPHAAFTPLLQPQETVHLRPDDLDPSFTHYELLPEVAAVWLASPAVTDFCGAITLRSANWLAPEVQPGGVAELLTVWQVQNPIKVGPLVPPAFTTDVVMFTQVLAENGQPWAQRDALDAPAWDWQMGDIILQVHPINIPDTAVPGRYETIVGIYDRQSGRRLPVCDDGGVVVDDKTAVLPLQVTDDSKK